MDFVLLGIPIGIVMLYFGSEWMVDGAKGMAFKFCVTPFVVGLTVVAFGSSAPEFITCVLSADVPEIIIGNVVGSNIANVGLAIGLAAFVAPISAKYESIRFELVSMVASVAVLAFFSLDGVISFSEGFALVIMLFMFIGLAYWIKKDSKDVEMEAPQCDMEGIPKTLPIQIAMVVGGILLLFFGAKFFIEGAKELAYSFGMSELLVGLLVVAVGTSLPEFSICIVAGCRGENELVVSNIVGSIIFNSFFALGAGALLVNVPISDPTLYFHIPVMLMFSIAMYVTIKNRNGVGRIIGAALVIAYVAYVASMGVFPWLT